jgi:hypothetical protein
MNVRSFWAFVRDGEKTTSVQIAMVGRSSPKICK